jgi:hypothetical protein
MTDAVHNCLGLSVGYGLIGTMVPRNRRPIIMLQFPEVPLLTTRGTRCPTLDKEFATR